MHTAQPLQTNYLSHDHIFTSSGPKSIEDDLCTGRSKAATTLQTIEIPAAGKPLTRFDCLAGVLKNEKKKTIKT
jgi:hypothetical protein